MVRIAVLASGGGTNLQALIDHFNVKANAVARVALVMSDRETAGALDRARAAGIPARVIPVRGRPADDVARDTLLACDEESIDIIALAGYLRLVPEAVVRRFRNRMLNIHPALLPAFGGAGMYGIRVHQAVLDAGAFVTGVTVHWVDERYDEGRPVVQWPVPVLQGDTAEKLAARVLKVEHRVYAAAIEAVAARLAEEEPVTETVGEPAGAGFHATDPATFEWGNDEGDGTALHRLLERQGDAT